jgi:hypothetical protein
VKQPTGVYASVGIAVLYFAGNINEGSIHNFQINYVHNEWNCDVIGM